LEQGAPVECVSASFPPFSSPSLISNLRRQLLQRHLSRFSPLFHFNLALLVFRQSLASRP
jgi:hypothetical protein